MRQGPDLVWDTCAIITLIKEGLDPFLRGDSILEAQTKELRYVSPSTLAQVHWVKAGVGRVDQLLVESSLRGHVVVTLDRRLVRIIRQRGGRVLHYKTVRDHLLGHKPHPWLL